MLSFHIQEIVDILVAEYDDGTGIDLLFEGNSDEFQELKTFVQSLNNSSISLKKSAYSLTNARDILPEVLSILIKLRSFFLKNLNMTQPYKSFKMQQNLRFHYWFWEIIVQGSLLLSIHW